ncbi:MAG: tRNA (adenosine(37)-N6)-dimethylallyltransferase MiaA [Pelagibacterales bacterium]|nr:tRNA (adenosine(37)-N6)-dimethylallyltransferase MiaA [Pelagibacterales bacterium]
MDLKSKIILIAGPTSSGKSNFALKLAKKIKGEIINADSMQVYKQLQILTARPKKKELKKIKHHLYGFCDVKKKHSTGEWLKLLIMKIKDIRKRKKVPIVVGGTGLYFKALTDGLVKIPNIPINVRNKVRLMQKKLGQKRFYIKLLKLDPLIKNKINKNDVQRSVRAYEIKHKTKKSIIEWFKKTKVFFSSDEFIKFYIDHPREKLINRINLRVEGMFKDGAIEEVRRFNKIKVKKENSSNKVIGIKEITNLLNKQCTLEQAKELIAIKTRQYAKRQVTWARGQMQSWQKINPNNLSLTLKKLK